VHQAVVLHVIHHHGDLYLAGTLGLFRDRENNEAHDMCPVSKMSVRAFSSCADIFT